MIPENEADWFLTTNFSTALGLKQCCTSLFAGLHCYQKGFESSAFHSLLSAAPAQGHVSDHLPTQPWLYIHFAKRLESSPWKQDSHIFIHTSKKSKVGFQSLWSQNSAPEWNCDKLRQVVDKALPCLCPWLRGCSCSCEPRIRRKWRHYFTANGHWESSQEVCLV